MSEILAIENLSKVYQMGDNEVRALDGVSLTVAAGEMLAIMGPSGSGKSTMMNIIGCLDQPSSGTYFLAGREVGQMSESDKARLRNQEIGFVFQSFNLLPKLTAWQNVELPLIYAKVEPKERKERAREALVKMGLEKRITHTPKELSGGQQQRVAIARALVNAPKFLLADEPTGNLDSRSSLEIMGIFQELHQKGITVILVTHEEEIAIYTQRVIRFRDGRIVADQSNDQKFIARGED
ncbi:MAG TPA: ABC transporter ATP-binding protein [Bacillota bacterium]|nr:ABC transporter ATP-binding protein [Bacillota bacterium]